MAITITGDYLMRQYLGITNNSDILQGVQPMGGLGKLVVANGNPSTLTIPSTSSGSTYFFDSAAGIVYTLPAPAACVAGTYFDFLCTVSITSNAAKVITDTTTTFLVGGISSTGTTTAGANYGANGTTIRALSSNGSTTGGLIGSYFRVMLINATQWAVYGILSGSGTLATPFATS